MLSICYQIGRKSLKFSIFPGLEPGKTGYFRILLTPTRFENFYPVSLLGVLGTNSAYFPTKSSVFLSHLTGLSVFGIKLTSRFVLTFRRIDGEKIGLLI